MNYNESKDKWANVEFVKQEPPQVDDAHLELMQHDIHCIKSEILPTEKKLQSAISNILKPDVIGDLPWNLKLETLNCPIESDKSIFIKQELLHEEFEIKGEEDAIQQLGFDDKYSSRSHHTIIPNEARLFKCNSCSYSFKRNAHLQKHLRTHTGEKPLKCNICDYICGQSSILQIHLRTHTGEKPFKCHICEHSFGQKGHLKTHLRTHTGEKPFKCTICSYSFRENSTFRRHLRSHTESKVMGNRSWDLKSEISDQNCHAQSDENIFIKQELFLHEELDIKTEDEAIQAPCVDDKNNSGSLLHQNTRMPSKANPLKCTICDYSCERRGALQAHLRTHTGEKPFTCNICDHSYGHKSQLKLHLRIHTGEKPFKCNFCNSSFGDKGILTRHLRIHTGEKPFKCNICNYSCGRRSTLQNHLRTHTGDKPYKCNICDYSFAQSGYLQTHLRTHNGEKPFKCNICEYSCTQSTNLRTHLRTHNAEKPFKCNETIVVDNIVPYSSIEELTLERSLLNVIFVTTNLDANIN